MIELLVNKNKEPTGGGWEKVVYSDDYDWNEDQRVCDVVDELSKHTGENLWWCLMEHMKDERYSITFFSNDYRPIASVGILCWQKAAKDLRAPYDHPDVIDDRFTRSVQPVRHRDSLEKWYAEHQDVPLYRQQIDLGEAILKRLDRVQKRGPRDHYNPSEEEKVQIRAAVKARMELLEQTQKPMFSNEKLVWED